MTDPADRERFSCPSCQRSLSAGTSKCPHCGSAIAITHVREKGALVERPVPMSGDEREGVEDLDDFESGDPPGGEG